jgi:hypothetical protein
MFGKPNGRLENQTRDLVESRQGMNIEAKGKADPNTKAIRTATTVITAIAKAKAKAKRKAMIAMKTKEIMKRTTKDDEDDQDKEKHDDEKVRSTRRSCLITWKQG